MTGEELVSQARQDGVKLVRFLFCDSGGLIRGKAAHINVLASRLVSGIGLTPAQQAMNMFDQFHNREDINLGPAGEVRLVPDLETYRRLPFAPESAQVCCDLLEHTQEPWDACPRSFLKRQIARARGRGLRVVAAFENEFFLFRQVGGEFVPVGEQVYASTVAFNAMEAVTQELIQALVDMGLEVEQYHPEWGDGQHEVAIGPAEALQAADNQILVRETVKGVCARHGIIATFTPKPFPDEVGSGAHLHLSLWDADGTRNLTYDPDDRYGMSKLAYHFIAGVLRHGQGLTALLNPTVNSYRRLQPQTWSSGFTCYGYDNRETMVRIQSTYWGRADRSANFEIRTPDGTCNPYLALGGVIAAGLDGIERELDPGEPVGGDPFRIPEEERLQRGILPVPSSLAVAVDELEKDAVLRGAMSELLFASFATVKRSEHQWCTQQEFSVEQRHHILQF